MRAVVTQEKLVVRSVALLHETDNCVVLTVHTEDKQPVIKLVNSTTLIFDDARVRFEALPFEDPMLIYMPDRHCIQVCIFNGLLQHAYTFNTAGETLFDVRETPA